MVELKGTVYNPQDVTEMCEIISELYSMEAAQELLRLYFAEIEEKDREILELNREVIDVPVTVCEKMKEFS